MKIFRSLVGAICLGLTFSAATLRAQNVAIDVANPQSKLSVNGTTSSGGLAIGDSSYTSTAGIIAPTNGALIEGNVGIGLTTPQVPLHVDGSIWVAPGGVTGPFWDGLSNIDGTEIDLFGLVGIQRSSGADICASKPAGFSNNWIIQFPVNGVTVGVVTTDGTSVAYNTTSDRRLKENIRPTSKGLNDVMKIQVSDYNFKSNPGQIKPTPGPTETGFIAQQLYTVFPGAVSPGGDEPATKPWMVDYGRVTPLLTKAIQEEQGEIEVLKQQNTKVTSQLAAVESENAGLKAEVAQLKAANEDLRVTAVKIEELEKMMAALQRKAGSETRAVALER